MAKVSHEMMDDQFIDELNRILKNGNTVELKKENNKLVLVEIHRKVKQKISMTG